MSYENVRWENCFVFLLLFTSLLFMYYIEENKFYEYLLPRNIHILNLHKYTRTLKEKQWDDKYFILHRVT